MNGGKLRSRNPGKSGGLTDDHRIGNAARSNNFDGLRFTGVLLVLWSYMFAVSAHWEPRFLRDHSFGNLGALIIFQHEWVFDISIVAQG